MSGAVFAAANATNNEAPQTTVDNGAVVATPKLKAFAVSGESKIANWGVPKYVVAPEKPVEATPAVQEAPVTEVAPVEEQAPAVEETPVTNAEPNVAVQAETVETIEATPAPAQNQSPAPTQEAAPAPQQETAPAPAPAQEATPAPVAPSQEATPAQKTTPAPSLATATNQSKRDSVVAAALYAASVNAQTDCTTLATNALSAAGINFHGWPMDYMSLGTVTSNPQPGDLVIYASNGFGQQHVAIYIGNGQAVHGGWNGMGTSVFSVNLPTASAPIFVTPAGYNN